MRWKTIVFNLHIKCVESDSVIICIFSRANQFPLNILRTAAVISIQIPIRYGFNAFPLALNEHERITFMSHMKLWAMHSIYRNRLGRNTSEQEVSGLESGLISMTLRPITRNN